uniref:Uncharacterized protein n=1 Tax=Amazona collaria TaxID=241587 RepID=A0A8B9FNC1_9PSIT
MGEDSSCWVLLQGACSASEPPSCSITREGAMGHSLHVAFVPSFRLHEPEKSSEANTQESDPNNLTYADLNFEKERKTIRRMVEMSQQSEYACIQSSRAPNGDDNLTYADLDMVHLSKAPPRPAPRPEEAGSEYASVQIPRK